MKVVDDWRQRANENTAMGIRLDSAGHKTEATEHYRRAVDALNKLVHFYPDYHLNQVWISRANAYQNRIKVIERAEP